MADYYHEICVNSQPFIFSMHTEMSREDATKLTFTIRVTSGDGTRFEAVPITVDALKIEIEEDKYRIIQDLGITKEDVDKSLLLNL